MENSLPRHTLSIRREVCNLCLAEKYAILIANDDALLNKRTKLINMCQHKNKYKLINVKLNTRFTAIFLPLRLPLSRFRLNIIIDLLSAFLCVFLPNNNH